MSAMPECPHHVAFEPGRHGDGEHAAFAIAPTGGGGLGVAAHRAHRERRRLAAVVLFRLDEVVGTERDLNGLVAIEVGIAERQRDGAVLVLVEAVEERRHALAVGRQRRERPLSRCLCSHSSDARRRQDDA
jgi:hypothetical protein